MRKIKILTAFGTRPEVIKLAPFIKELENDQQFISVTCATSQHKELQNDVMEIFDIKANYNLDIMRVNQDLFHITGTALEKMKIILDREQPDYVVVQGDTTTAFAVALSGFYCRIPVVHIEAGLRTWDLTNPYPEEGNRQLISKIATLHMAPTAAAVANLSRESITSNVFNVGNTIVDAIQIALTKPLNNSAIINILCQKNVMITVHRRENFGGGLNKICQAISELAILYPNYNFIWPIHPNPNIKNFISDALSNLSNVILCKPLSYVEAIQVINSSQIILSDSGGIQEEACILGKFILILRDNTERPEVISAGYGILTGSNQKNIVARMHDLISKDRPMLRNDVYGTPGVAKRIIKIIKEHANS